ncbi:hypothetical protein GGQ04_003187 [Salinibacter ruber]|jgi:hypothetical protein|nr:hypothetical protein [Salinibacter ruber]
MHVPAHASRLPEGVAPIPVPDSRREAEVLLMLLNAGLYPKCADGQARRDGKDPARARGQPDPFDLTAAE